MLKPFKRYHTTVGSWYTTPTKTNFWRLNYETDPEVNEVSVNFN